MTRVQFKRLPNGTGLGLPSYETEGAAGMDLAAAIEDGSELVLAPRQRMLVPTGFAIALPKGYEAQVRPRSGLAIKHGISLINAPGTVDADYRGELMVPLVNHGTEDFTITRGMRIAQMVVAPVVQAIAVEVEELDDTGRGSGGFGSTGTDQK